MSLSGNDVERGRENVRQAPSKMSVTTKLTVIHNGKIRFRDPHVEVHCGQIVLLCSSIMVNFCVELSKIG